MTIAVEVSNICHLPLPVSNMASRIEMKMKECLKWTNWLGEIQAMGIDLLLSLFHPESFIHRRGRLVERHSHCKIEGEGRRPKDDEMCPRPGCQGRAVPTGTHVDCNTGERRATWSDSETRPARLPYGFNNASRQVAVLGTANPPT